MTRENSIICTSIIGIVANLLLVTVKLIVGIVADSISIILDAINNLTDALSSILTIIGTKLANKAPDKKHPYGYGRIEYITAAIIAAIVLTAGGTSIYESIHTLINKSNDANYSNISLILISLGIVVKIFIGLYFRYVGKKVSSGALLASGIDALYDSLLSFATLIGAIITRYAGYGIEPYLGILIGLFILKSGLEILMESFSTLLGERADDDLVAQIKATITSHPEVLGAYDLVLNNYGPDRTIGSVHIEVSDDMTAKQIHFLTRSISLEIYKTFHIITSIGIYASNNSDEVSRSIKSDLQAIVESDPLILQTHGFYVDFDTHTVTFDIIFDFKQEHPEEEARSIR